jgi:TonB-dependent starch-binding outer membrane protein SusC
MKIKRYLKNVGLLALLTTLCSVAFAQRTITGSVKDANSGETLVGASVVVTGTSKGTLTDVEGKYSLADVGVNAASLTFSFTGYASVTIPIGTLKVIDCTLNGGSILDEIIVVGYGSVKKSDATGAIVALDEKNFNRGVLTSPEQLIQGRAAGVQISQNGGEPGGGISIRIRGTSSVNGGKNPLFVIDGVPLSGDNSTPGGQAGALGGSSARNPLNYLNPNDIEKIDILKDASSTAIYGARGANGVVLITTKRGKKGAGSFDYAYSLGASQITKKYDLLSAEAFAAAVPASNLGSSTDWQNVVLQTGLSQSHSLSYGGGTDKGTYRFSGGYMDQEGIFKQSGFTRYNVRFNGDQRLMNDKLYVGVSVTAAKTLDRAVPITNNSGFEGDLLARMLVTNPTTPIYTFNDSKTLNCDTCAIFQPSSSSETSPAAVLRYTKDETKTLRITGNVFAEYKIFEDLTFKTVLGFDESQSQRRSAISPLLNIGNNRSVIKGSNNFSNVSLTNTLWDDYLTYTKKVGDIDVTALLGYSYQSFTYQNDAQQMIGFPTSRSFTSDINYQLNNAGSATKSVVNYSGITTDELQSVFGRVNVGYKDKYLITASIRRDGSTRFAKDKRYGTFPSFAFKWRLIQENFIPKNIFSDLGLRVGYGITGNQQIPHDLYSQRYRYGDSFFNGDGNYVNGAYYQVANNSSSLQWESTKQVNIGLDFGFLKNRLTGSVDYYEKHTDKLLIQVEGDGSKPTSGQWLNLPADVQNRGVELSLNFVAIDTKDFRWTIAGNIAQNDNIVKNLLGVYNTGAINGQGLSGAYAQQIVEGQPLGAFFIRQADGFYTADDLAKGQKKGLTRYLDGNDAAQLIGKSGLPTLTGGLTNTLTYKGLDVSFFFNGVFGSYIYNNTANAFFTQGSLQSGRNVTTNVVNNGESAANAPEPSTRFLEKGDFVRLANVSVGYNLPLGTNKSIKSVRLFLSGQNILTFTNYTGQDPEVNTDKNIGGIPSFGIDYTAYPRARTVTIGASVAF